MIFWRSSRTSSNPIGAMSGNVQSQNRELLRISLLSASQFDQLVLDLFHGRNINSRRTFSMEAQPIAPSCSMHRGAAITIQHHELRSSEFIGAWIGSCLGEGKCLRPASGRCAPWLVAGGEEGFNGNRNQQNYLSTMERGKVKLGAEILRPISREFGKSIEWLPTG